MGKQRGKSKGTRRGKEMRREEKGILFGVSFSNKHVELVGTPSTCLFQY